MVNLLQRKPFSDSTHESLGKYIEDSPCLKRIKNSISQAEDKEFKIQTILNKTKNIWITLLAISIVSFVLALGLTAVTNVIIAVGAFLVFATVSIITGVKAVNVRKDVRVCKRELDTAKEEVLMLYKEKDELLENHILYADLYYLEKNNIELSEQEEMLYDTLKIELKNHKKFLDKYVDEEFNKYAEIKKAIIKKKIKDTKAKSAKSKSKNKKDIISYVNDELSIMDMESNELDLSSIANDKKS